MRAEDGNGHDAEGITVPATEDEPEELSIRQLRKLMLTQHAETSRALERLGLVGELNNALLQAMVPRVELLAREHERSNADVARELASRDRIVAGLKRRLDAHDTREAIRHANSEDERQKLAAKLSALEADVTQKRKAVTAEEADARASGLDFAVEVGKAAAQLATAQVQGRTQVEVAQIQSTTTVGVERSKGLYAAIIAIGVALFSAGGCGAQLVARYFPPTQPVQPTTGGK